MLSEAERHFHADMVAVAERLKNEIGYHPRQFLRMVAERGAVDAARQLLRGADVSYGFTTLWEHDRLALSVEAFSLLPWYRDLFTEDQRETAERRLTEHRFDVDGFLLRTCANPPAWTSPGDESSFARPRDT